jgi:hypothetical protein
MSERVVDNPANHGWTDAGGGKWTWAGSGTDGGGGSIQDGDTTGQVTTWNGTEWEPNASLTFESDGDAGFVKNVKADGFQFGNDCGTRTTSGTNVVPTDGDGSATNATIDLGASNYQWKTVHSDEVNANTVCSGVDGRAGFTFGGSNVILPANNTTVTNGIADLGRDGNRFKDAYFTGTVDAGAITINGSPISSGGGGGGGFMIPVQQPQTAGEFKWGVASSGGTEVFGTTYGNWYCNKTTNTMTMPVPPGYKFVLQNFIANADSSSAKMVLFDGIYLDGVQINTSPEVSGKYKITYPSGDPQYDRKYLWPTAVNYVCESSVQFTIYQSGDTWFHIFGYFIAADGTRESAELRKAYLVEEAERIASMPAPEPELELEVGTQEIPE